MVWMIWVLWALVLLGGLFGVWCALRSARHQIWILLTIAALALAVRGSFRSDYFYGLEYEDAYVYAVASRHLTPTTSVWKSSGLTVCAVGSLDECTEWERFPGHLPGFPAILRAVQVLVGNRPALAPWCTTYQREIGRAILTL